MTPRTPATEDTTGETELPSYGNLATLIDALPLIVREMRRAHRLTMRDVAEAAGVSQSTIHRLEHRTGGLAMENVIAILQWLDRLQPEQT